MNKVHIDCSDYSEELQEMLQSGVKYEVEPNLLRTKDYEFTFAPEFTPQLEQLSQFCNPLIYGKNTMLGIVGIEINSNSELELFFSDNSTKTFPYKPWVLLPKQEKASDTRLEGFLHYKYLHYLSKGENTWRLGDKFQIYNDREAAMAFHGITLFKGLKPSQLGVLSFDIETTGLSHEKDSKVFLITNCYEKNGVRLFKHFRLDHYQNSGEMISDWCFWVRELNPDVITGHNIYGYDFPFLDFVARKYGKRLTLGRSGEEIEFGKKTSEYRVDGNNTWTYNKASIYGRSIIDTMFLSVKYDFDRKFPSWGLKPIVEHLKLQKSGRTFYDASKIRDNWDNPIEREKIVAYAVDDSEDALNLYNKMIPAYFFLSQSLPIPFTEMMQGATGKWMNSIVVRSYLQDGHSIPKPDDKIYVHGGISFGNAGLYKNLYKVDVTSLYPSCILTYGIYPTKKDPNKNFLKMVQVFTEERIRNKKKYKETGDKYYDALQNAQKVAINSSYGMLGTNGLAFNDFTAANQVTLKGRAVLRKAIIWASGKDVGEWFSGYEYEKDEGMNVKTPINHDFIIGPTDTDSISFCKKNMESFSDKEQKDLLNELNGVMDKGISFEDDGYFSHVLAVAAKNYILVRENGEVTVKGSSIKDAKKEPILRKFMDEVIQALLYETGTIPEIYDRYCDFARNIKDISQWCVKKSISKKLLSSDRPQELCVVKALGQDLPNYREGDKVFIYNTTPELVPVMIEEEVLISPAVKEGRKTIAPAVWEKTGRIVEDTYASGPRKGEVKMKEVTTVKLEKNYQNDADVEHYLSRTYATLSIFENVLDMSKFTCYTK